MAEQIRGHDVTIWTSAEIFCHWTVCHFFNW